MIVHIACLQNSKANCISFYQLQQNTYKLSKVFIVPTSLIQKVMNMKLLYSYQQILKNKVGMLKLDSDPNDPNL